MTKDIEVQMPEEDAAGNSRKWKISFRPTASDAFIGVRTQKVDFDRQKALHYPYHVRLFEVTICILPMLPIRVLRVDTWRGSNYEDS